MKVLALICTRNEELTIGCCLNEWIGNGCDVILVDNASEDRTLEIASSYMGRGLMAIERLPWKGYFSLRDQLALKKRIINNSGYDWVVHADADEVLRTPWENMPLAAGIERADSGGFTCINFKELVFVPWPDQDFSHSDYARCMDTYYFFEPHHQPRLMRAWRRDLYADNIESGGHALDGPGVKLCADEFFLCHYIALSLRHACQKYIGRQFDQHELAQGWHHNRTGITAGSLVLKPSPFLKRLSNWSHPDFDLATPSHTHFWQW